MSTATVNPTTAPPSVRRMPAGRMPRYTSSPLDSLPMVKDSTVSPQALELFRLIQRLSRRSGYACVKLLETLAKMHERGLRATRYALAELLAAGWIKRTQTRKGGTSKLFFFPLVQVARKSRGIFAPPPSRPSPAENSAGCVAGSPPSSLQVTPSVSFKDSPVGKEDDNIQAKQVRAKTPKEPEALPEEVSVAVSLLRSEVPESEALGLAREATKQGRTPDQIKRILSAFRAQIGNIRNRGAWLRSAIRDNYAPPIDAPSHASDRGERPQRPVTTPPEELAKMRAAEQARQDREVAFEAAWKALDDTAMKARLEVTREQLRAKGGFYRSKSDSPTYVQNTARSEFRAEWEAAHPVGVLNLPTDHAPKTDHAPQEERHP